MNRNQLNVVPAVLTVCLISGCSFIPERDDSSYGATLPPAPLPASEAKGAIYQAGRDIALFEDIKARRVGDIVTIVLVERTDATKSSSTTTSKTTSATITNPTVFGRPITRNGNPLLSGGLSSNSSFAGEGDSSQSNRLEGSITVTIAEQLSNGYLVVRGEKWVALNQGKEFIRISGIIRPVDIQPDNTVLSSQVGDAKISYGGKGAPADANRMGLLARFFNHPWSGF